jgi:NAD(P)-dependent dehydrogenase (short-subunit alcohol dehydrogenase family)
MLSQMIAILLDMKIPHKTFVVTGAGSGLGRALTLQLLERGARVAAIDIHSDALAETQALARVGDDQFRAFVLDITDKTKVDALPGMVVDHFGGVDGLINNAGIIQKFTPVIDLTVEEINRVVNVNFYGTVYMTKAFLPWLLKRRKPTWSTSPAWEGLFHFRVKPYMGPPRPRSNYSQKDFMLNFKTRLSG